MVVVDNLVHPVDDHPHTGEGEVGKNEMKQVHGRVCRSGGLGRPKESGKARAPGLSAVEGFDFQFVGADGEEPEGDEGNDDNHGTEIRL